MTMCNKTEDCRPQGRTVPLLVTYLENSLAHKQEQIFTAVFTEALSVIQRVEIIQRPSVREWKTLLCCIDVMESRTEVENG